MLKVLQAVVFPPAPKRRSVFLLFTPKRIQSAQHEAARERGMVQNSSNVFGEGMDKSVYSAAVQKVWLASIRAKLVEQGSPRRTRCRWPRKVSGTPKTPCLVVAHPLGYF